MRGLSSVIEMVVVEWASNKWLSSLGSKITYEMAKRGGGGGACGAAETRMCVNDACVLWYKWV
jgi:hypothetical protein